MSFETVNYLISDDFLIKQCTLSIILDNKDPFIVCKKRFRFQSDMAYVTCQTIGCINYFQDSILKEEIGGNILVVGPETVAASKCCDWDVFAADE